MKTISLLVICLLAVVSAAPAEVPQILLNENESDGRGNYKFAFKTSDGIERQESSNVINAGDPEKEYVIVRGSFSYIGPDGVTYTVTYTADENGFHPEGAHLPVPPEIVEKMMTHSLEVVPYTHRSNSDIGANSNLIKTLLG